MTIDNDTEATSLRIRSTRFFDRLEAVYLRILRVFILLFATALVVYAVVLGATALVKMSRSVESVIEEPATVSGADLLPAEGAEIAPRTNQPAEQVTNSTHRNFYQGFARRYHALFRQHYEPFRQAEDRQLSLDAFDDAYLNTDNRLRAISQGTLSFESDRADLELLLTAMNEAATNPETRQRLQRYKGARKVRVCRNVQRERTVYRNGWDSSSMACPDWYYPPYGCPVRRAVQQPYSERVCAMEFPEGTRSHADIFRAYHDRFFALLNDRREANAAQAENERVEIVTGNVEGAISLAEAGWVFAGFLVVMFFFLLIAIERHQRKLAVALEQPTARRAADDDFGENETGNLNPAAT